MLLENVKCLDCRFFILRTVKQVFFVFAYIVHRITLQVFFLFRFVCFYCFILDFRENMINFEIDGNTLGHCGPLGHTPHNSQLVSKVLYDDVSFDFYPCFENVSVFELMDPDTFDITLFDNSFEMNFELRNVQSLDNIENGNVAILFFQLDCGGSDESISSTTERIVYDLPALDSGVTGRIGPVDLNMSCNYAGCTVRSSIEVVHDYQDLSLQCNLPILNLYFWQTDFLIDSEYLMVALNDKYFGRCDGIADNDFSQIYQCLWNADISEWIFDNHLTDILSVDDYFVTQLFIDLTITDNVDSLESMTPNGHLLDAKVEFECFNITSTDTNLRSKRIIEKEFLLYDADTIASNGERQNLTAHVECQGAGCNASVTFNIKGTCYNPHLIVQFWLSDFLVFNEYVDTSINDVHLERCFGGADESFDAIYSCFGTKNIQHYLSSYSYNDNIDESDYKLINSSIKIGLDVSEGVDWLDHGKNHSLFDGYVTLACIEDSWFNDATDTINHGENGANSTDSFTIVYLVVSFERVTSDELNTHKAEILEKFSYALDATIHLFGEEDSYYFNALAGSIDVIHATFESDFQIFVETRSHDDAVAIEDLIDKAYFLLYFQETLKSSSLSDIVVDSINDLSIIQDLPPTKEPTIEPTHSPTVGAGLSSSEVNRSTMLITDDSGDSDDSGGTGEYNSGGNSDELFATVSMTDVFALLGVFLGVLCIGVCCCGCVYVFCIKMKQRSVRRDIQEYRETIEGSMSSGEEDEEAGGGNANNSEYSDDSDDNNDRTPMTNKKRRDSVGTHRSHHSSRHSSRHGSRRSSVNHLSPKHQKIAKKLRRHSVHRRDSVTSARTSHSHRHHHHHRNKRHRKHRRGSTQSNMTQHTADGSFVGSSRMSGPTMTSSVTMGYGHPPHGGAPTPMSGSGTHGANIAPGAGGTVGNGHSGGAGGGSGAGGVPIQSQPMPPLLAPPVGDQTVNVNAVTMAGIQMTNVNGNENASITPHETPSTQNQNDNDNNNEKPIQDKDENENDHDNENDEESEHSPISQLEREKRTSVPLSDKQDKQENDANGKNGKNDEKQVKKQSTPVSNLILVSSSTVGDKRRKIKKKAFNAPLAEETEQDTLIVHDDDSDDSDESESDNSQSEVSELSKNPENSKGV